ncbi:hypothetical protein INT43_008892 [Umbelopsis isabellina]|uniref:tRNA/rRNA methyltransferase SpoU type domain-containing protein n=1 Tax=Mortierella isabellina TaxID=91625 RepID=A0A8H7PXK5_MORIS|nr:hypothetical protein INT43_008892 [Umbelopsis isabellina]
MSRAFATKAKAITHIHGTHNQTVKHLVKLREKKAYRSEQRSALVQGKQTILELLDRNITMRSIGMTVANSGDQAEIDQTKFPAERYFICDINNTQRILGTASRPSGSEMFAEAIQPNISFPEKPDKLVVFNRITDPGNLGTLIRTARALGWSAAVLTDNTCDLTNDKTLRASKAASIDYPYKIIPSSHLSSVLRAMNMTPVIADTLPLDMVPRAPSHTVTLWNKTQRSMMKVLPRRVALVLSSEHHGPKNLENEDVRVSIPMHGEVESLNVASAGSILLYQLNSMLSN